MRTLLRLLLTTLLAGAVLWVTLPLAASTLARGAVVAAGLEGEDIEVTVLADPPLKLLLLEADAVRISAGLGTWRGISFTGIDATVATTRLGGPLGAVEARLEGVQLPSEDGARLRVGTVLVSGPLASADLRIRLSSDDLEVALRQALPPDLGSLAGAITLAPPDGLRIATAGGDVAARLILRPDGSLDLSVDGPGGSSVTVTVLRAGAALPVRLQSVTVDDSWVELRGTLDARDLGL